MLNTQLLGVLLLCSVLGLSVQVSLHDPEADRELARYRARVKLVHDLLLSERCPDLDIRMNRRAPDDSRSQLLLEIEKALLEQLLDRLLECRQVSQMNSMQTTTATPTTTTPTTTTHVRLPESCEEAVNLTEAWRHESSPRDQRPINGSVNCDPRDMISQGRPWFRITGAAGSRLLDHCIPNKRCGTFYTLWSNATMPTDIGVATNIQMYGSSGFMCTWGRLLCSVMRCSDKPNDFIYRWRPDYIVCDYGFCGMD